MPRHQPRRITTVSYTHLANIILLSQSLGVPLDSAQAQAFIDNNQFMMEGGGFTVSEVSFKLACMRILNTLRDRFAVKSWRVIDESDLIGSRYVQASMLLSICLLYTSRCV